MGRSEVVVAAAQRGEEVEGIVAISTAEPIDGQRSVTKQPMFQFLLALAPMALTRRPQRPHRSPYKDLYNICKVCI